MSDILTQYFENITRQEMKSLKMYKQSSTLSQDLSEYRLFLSQNNILTFTPHKSLSFIRKANSKNNKYSNINFPSFFSEKTSKYNIPKIQKKDKNIIVEINEEKPFSSDENGCKQNNIYANNNKLKIKKDINNRNTVLENYKKNLKFLKKNMIFKEKSSLIQNSFDIKNNLNAPNIKSIKKEIKIKNEEEEKKIETILKNLMKSEKKKKVNVNKKKSFPFSYYSTIHPTISPMKYIKMNFSENPHKINKFKSYNIQIKAIGNLKYRNFLLDGINFFKNNFVKYKNLKPTIVYNSKYEENQKENNKQINEMIQNTKQTRFIFNLINNNIKKKKKLSRNIDSFSFEKENKTTGYKRIDNLNSRLISISKKEIDDLNKYVEKNKHLFSFDKKINLILLKAQKTSKYINKKAEEYDKINKKIFEAL